MQYAQAGKADIAAVNKLFWQFGGGEGGLEGREGDARGQSPRLLSGVMTSICQTALCCHYVDSCRHLQCVCTKLTEKVFLRNSDESSVKGMQQVNRYAYRMEAVNLG